MSLEVLADLYDMTVEEFLRMLDQEKKRWEEGIRNGQPAPRDGETKADQAKESPILTKAEPASADRKETTL